MKPEEQQWWPEQVRTSLEECFDQIHFARSRRFLEAEALLSRQGQLPDNARDLDLLARMAAEQKQLEKARRYWGMALQKEPQNETYRGCPACVGRAEMQMRLLDIVFMCLAGFAVAFGIGVLVYMLPTLR